MMLVFAPDPPMFLLDAAAILLCLAALFGLINQRLLKLPFTIGLLVSGLLASVGVLIFDALVPSAELGATVRDMVHQLDFAQAVLSGMLSLLLFAGALHTSIELLKDKLVPILTLASVGVLISASVAGALAYAIFSAIGIEISFVWCLVFGVLISPTDPIAVLGVMKAVGAPKHLEIKVVGESLFNDGTSMVVFAVLVGLAQNLDAGVDWSEVGVLLTKEIVGGVLLGLIVGLLCYRALSGIDDPNLAILITLAGVFGLSFVAGKLHLSAPLAAVVAGLFVGNRARAHVMSEETEHALDTVWTFIDETLNALLFLLIGVEILAIDYSRVDYVIAASLAIPAVLLARLAGVALPVSVLRSKLAIQRGTVRVLTWGGIKGGVSIALAMRMPEFPGRNAVLTATYAVVVFSIIVQGLSLGRLIKRFTADEEPA